MQFPIGMGTTAAGATGGAVEPFGRGAGAPEAVGTLWNLQPKRPALFRSSVRFFVSGSAQILSAEQQALSDGRRRLAHFAAVPLFLVGLFCLCESGGKNRSRWRQRRRQFCALGLKQARYISYD
ncbi:uncharacterized protein LOC127010630 [Drosophila biarmipes]|uniref:uncharacterized protein LOC127010630 n=1 Tax=Drosophila biarmipes TaxID=125945 RepID=UPI0021CCB5D6|nr:uncharacterized protein LOC127010630 [Drosophila biarmipes]